MIPNNFTRDFQEMSGFGSALNGITGIMSSSLAVITTFQTELDWWVRFLGSVILLAISSISLYNMIRQLVSKLNKK
jgi:uncharacterized membrane protein YesL